jgi:hypothetical protein
MGEGAGHPAAADDTAAQGGEGLDFGNEGHGNFLKNSVIPCRSRLAGEGDFSAAEDAADLPASSPASRLLQG